MNASLKLSRHVAVVLLLSAALVSCASGPNIASPDLLQRVEAARTQGDCKALAIDDDREATADRPTAAQHQTMAKNNPAMIANGKGSASMPAHCNAIVSAIGSAVAEYQGVSAGYHQIGEASPDVSPA